jgi:gamma-glutamyl:cysteine ligase YbdK (ATP-grasp superfamily)
MFAFLSPSCYFLLGVFNRCFMCSPSARAISCPEHARLEEEYRAARDRMRGWLRLRKLTRMEERRLADEVAMAIARLKAHAAKHGCERR